MRKQTTQHTSRTRSPAPTANSAKAPATRSVTLTLDAQQMAILLGLIEGTFDVSDDGRGAKLLAEAIKSAASTWNPEGGNEFQYHVVRMAPVYRQLAEEARRLKAPAGSIFDASSPEEFAEALRIAKAA